MATKINLVNDDILPNSVDTGTLEFNSLSGTGTVAVTDILDEDTLVSNSATALATQQSIKAYVDSEISTIELTPGPEGPPGPAGADGADGINSTVTVGTTAPTSPAIGDIWVDTN